MTVNKLSSEQKKQIGEQYKAKKLNQKELAGVYSVSERTINHASRARRIRSCRC